MTRTVSAAGRVAITLREGCRLEAYLDTAGNPTIGVGHFNATPPVTRMGMKITAAQADALLTADLAPMERAVNAADLKARLSQNAFDAATSLAFNIGVGAFSRSTVARCIANDDMAGAAEAILMWDKPAVLLGRRKAERAQFLTPDGVTDNGRALIREVSGVTVSGAPLNAHAGAVATVTLPKPAPAPYMPPVAQQHAPTPAAKPGFWAGLVAAFTPTKKAS